MLTGFAFLKKINMDFNQFTTCFYDGAWGVCREAKPARCPRGVVGCLFGRIVCAKNPIGRPLTLVKSAEPIAEGPLVISTEMHIQG